jgi:predicted ribosome quality control (RQC) complex YloA/Tae2 family protein
VLLLIESGVRMHTTAYQRDKSVVPSSFTLKVRPPCAGRSDTRSQLRKHLRGKRLNEVRQCGIDRVVDLTCGYAETAFHVIVEFYASVRRRPGV